MSSSAAPILAVISSILPQLTNLGAKFPGQLAGLSAAFAAMVLGSVLPQLMTDRHVPREREALKAEA